MTKNQEFKKEFLALLRKYNAEMYVRNQMINGGLLIGGVSFSFESEDYITTVCSDLDLGTFENGKEFV